MLDVEDVLDSWTCGPVEEGWYLPDKRFASRVVDEIVRLGVLEQLIQELAGSSPEDSFAEMTGQFIDHLSAYASHYVHQAHLDVDVN